MSKSILIGCLFLLSCVNSIDRIENHVISTLGFGSCSKQDKPQHYWKVIKDQKLDGWIWTGDSIYPNCSEPHCLKVAYDRILSSSDYSEFVNEVPFIDGTWDDHDYGKNDGGIDYSAKIQSQQLFLDFLNISKHSKRRFRDGVYSSHLLTLNNNKTTTEEYIKLILLDTRSQRQLPWLPSFGHLKFPFASAISAALRVITTQFGLGWNHPGDILGEDQWNWMEHQLKETKNVVSTIIVSSIQVMTSVPAFESWGHFPQSKRRFFKLIQKTRPPGLLILSGDIHMGQLLGDPNCVVELTSSGLTHSILTHTLLGGVLTDIILPLFQKKFSVPHLPNSRLDPKNKEYYEGQNFGVLIYLKHKNKWKVIGTIHDIQGRPKLRIEQIFEKNQTYECLNALEDLIPKRSWLEIILRVVVCVIFIFLAVLVVTLIIYIHVRAIKSVVLKFVRQASDQQNQNSTTKRRFIKKET